ncbi:MAG: CpsD/CapB family tyrosine-protein kinase, partial [Nostocaceae cyanobacterium]|nr:CpsD/CapB family tyrosine-protein kinase [Nostocaceae cyanobacterium]
DLHPAAQSVLVNLDVLTGGTLPPNPGALLDSQRMAALVQEASKHYDFVIIDTPPLTLFPDGLMLSKFADGILLLVRPGVVQSDAALTTKSLLEQSGQRVLGMVINGVSDGVKYGGYYSYKYDKRGAERIEMREVNIPNSKRA